MQSNCPIPDFVRQDNLDPKTKPCPPDTSNNVNNVPLVDDLATNKDRLGVAANCSPNQSGKIFENSNEVNRAIINRYPRSLRATDQAMIDLFSNVEVSDVQGKIFRVPIIWGTQEKAVAAIVQTNVRQDNSLVVDRIRLPIMSIYSSGLNYNERRYTYEEVKRNFPGLDGKPQSTLNERRERDTVLSFARGVPVDIEYILTIWTMYLEDANEIREQIWLRVPKMTYINVAGISWEIPVEIKSEANNIDYEPGESVMRVIKFQYTLNVEGYIAQPISRTPAILKTVTDYVSGTPENITEVISTETSTVEDIKPC